MSSNLIQPKEEQEEAPTQPIIISWINPYDTQPSNFHETSKSIKQEPELQIVTEFVQKFDNNKRKSESDQNSDVESKRRKFSDEKSTKNKKLVPLSSGNFKDIDNNTILEEKSTEVIEIDDDDEPKDQIHSLDFSKFIANLSKSLKVELKIPQSTIIDNQPENEQFTFIKSNDSENHQNNDDDDDDEYRLVIKEEEVLICDDVIEINEETQVKPKKSSKIDIIPYMPITHAPSPKNHSFDENSSSSNSEFTCETCQKSFKRRTDLLHHSKSHIDAKYNCIKCGMKFKNRKFFNKHECIICSICDKLCLTKRQLIDHKRIHHAKDGSKIEQYECDLCGREFKYRQAVVIHMHKEHMTESKCDYHCDVCGKIFDLKSKLQVHLKCHLEAIECRICGKKIKGRNLGSHMRYVHTNERKFKCNLCESSYKTKESMKSHMRRHDKKFPCQLCSKKFSTSYLLREHIKWHENPEKFECKDCNKLFAQKACYNAHMRMHKNGHNFEKLKCIHCSYSTDSAENFAKHEMKHKRQEENKLKMKGWFQCGKCPIKLKNKLRLATHYWKRHNSAPPPEK